MNHNSQLNFVRQLLFATALVLCLSNAAALAKEVISPEKFSGPVAAGYRAAQKAKDICGKLFCYCGCDLTDEHISLLDCFTSMHGVDCPICQEEAIIACRMKEQGKSLSQIQKAIDERFSAQYPWDEPSLTFDKYLKSTKVSGVNKSTVKAASTKYNTRTSKMKSLNKRHCCGH